MRRITILIILLLSCMGVLFAQAPEKFTYQAVVRNSNNQLVVNTQVGVQVYSISIEGFSCVSRMLYL